MLYFQSLADQICFLKICLAPDRVGAPRLRRSVWTLALWPEAYFSGEMEFLGSPRNSLRESLQLVVIRRNRWHLYQDSGAESKWRRIYDGRERLAPQLSHLLAPARRTARIQVIPSGVQSFKFGLG